MTFYCEALRTYSAYVVHFFLGQFPNMELLLLLSPFICFLLNCYISLSVGQYNSVFDRLSMHAYVPARPSNITLF